MSFLFFEATALYSRDLSLKGKNQKKGSVSSPRDDRVPFPHVPVHVQHHGAFRTS